MSKCSTHECGASATVFLVWHYKGTDRERIPSCSDCADTYGDKIFYGGGMYRIEEMTP